MTARAVRVLGVAALVLGGCAPPAVAPVAMRLLQANVGNVQLDCEPYVYKLCVGDVEDAITAGIAALAPDVIALQEVLPSSLCDGLPDDDATRTCFAGRRATEPDQARRIVGDDYAIACDDRHGYECVAVRTAWGAIDGAYDVAPPVTLADGTACDDGFSVGAVVIAPQGAAPFTLVNAHPQSGYEYDCRAAELTQIFDELAGDGPALITGDMNMDPWEDVDVSARVWVEHVGDDARFHYHSDTAEHDPPYLTLDLGGIEELAATLDHVVSDFADGVCATLGEHPGTTRLDGGAGTDHRALSCDLTVPASP